MTDSPRFAKFESCPESAMSKYVLKPEYFQNKYNNNLHIIRQIQHDKRVSQTPILKARRALQAIQDQESSIHSRRATSKSSFRQTTNSNAFTNTLRPNSHSESFQNMSLCNQLDLSAAQVYLTNLYWVQRCLQNKDETPNFQMYWESVCELRQELFLNVLKKPSSQVTVKMSLILNDISMAFIQCYLKELYNHHIEEIKEIKTIIKFLIENCALFLKKLLSMCKHKNQLADSLSTKIQLVLQRSNCSDNFIIDMRKNNSFLMQLIQEILKYEIRSMSATIITGRHCLHNIKYLEVQECRNKLINAIFLSTSQTSTQYVSPLKSLFQQPSQSMYQHQLRESYSNLEIVDAPYLPPFQGLTLVLDLDETLGYFNQTIGRFIERPGLNQFVEAMSKHYQIVVFTAGVQSYADHVINQLNCKPLITHTLYRQHTTLLEHQYVKDLSKLGRELSKVIIIDNGAHNFELQPDNGLLISTWTGNEHDTELEQLSVLLIRIAKSNTSDVRKSLRKYRDYISRLFKIK